MLACQIRKMLQEIKNQVPNSDRWRVRHSMKLLWLKSLSRQLKKLLFMNSSFLSCIHKLLSKNNFILCLKWKMFVFFQRYYQDSLKELFLELTTWKMLIFFHFTSPFYVCETIRRVMYTRNREKLTHFCAALIKTYSSDSVLMNTN